MSVLRKEWARAALGLAALAVGGCAQTANEAGPWAALPLSAVRINNRVSNCLTLEPARVVVHGSIAILEANGTFLASTASCGCSSAMLEYESSEQRTPDYRERWVRAVLSTRSAGAGATRLFELILTGDAALAYDQGVEVEIGCAPHD